VSKTNNRLIVELMPADVKLLKGLEGNKLYIFPTGLDASLQPNGELRPVLNGREAQWPVDNSEIFGVSERPVLKSEGIKEIRG